MIQLLSIDPYDDRPKFQQWHKNKTAPKHVKQHSLRQCAPYIKVHCVSLALKASF